MRRALISGLVLCALCGLILLVVQQAQITAWATAIQREMQNGLARGLRALRYGDAGAWTNLLAVCFAYGFFHAVGPGHGKFLVGAYSTSRDIGIGKLAGATILASFGQAGTALLLVFGGIGMFALTRQQLTMLAETTLAQFSLVSILLIGVWLLARGLRRGGKLMRELGSESTDDVHDHGKHCSHCGHAHAPTPDQIANAANWRELAAVIVAIAIRPCSGAILLLVLTWQMNILPAGIAGVFAMASGTACLTLVVAIMGTALRGGAIMSVVGNSTLRILGLAIEIAAGAVISLIAAGGLGLI